MENINAILEKLMLNRAALLMNRFDLELKEILENDLQTYRSDLFSNSSETNGNQMIAG